MTTDVLAVRARIDRDGDPGGDPGPDPFISAADVGGPYPPNVAAVVAALSMCDVPDRDGGTRREPDD
jgi:hypothetical protein